MACALAALPGQLAICRLPADAPVPLWASGGALSSAARTAGELSVVCPAEQVPPEVSASRGWRALRLEGPFDLGLVGVLVSVLQPLAAAQVSIFAVSTYDTDYVLVREWQLDAALSALRAAGHDARA